MLESIRQVLQDFCAGLNMEGPDVGAVVARLDEIERTRALWEAELEGVLLQAQNKFRAARAAEERARHLAKSFASDEDGLEELPEGIRELYSGDGEGGEAEGVQPVHESVGTPPTPQEWALRAKSG